MSEFDKYIVQGEPDKKAKASAWQTAIGLQDVDGLKPYRISSVDTVNVETVAQMLLKVSNLHA